MDVHSKEVRSHNMSQIRGTNTKPELLVRSLVHRLGFRFRLHRKDLPGRPDLVFVSKQKIIFVHGCFWHLHSCRWGQVSPKSNAEFWQAKRTGNQARDKRNETALRKDGWKVLSVWECEIRNLEKLTRRLTRFLSD